jgi:saccharopine dehydrogenase (NADP+, L-glutamate forming)
VTQSLHRVTQRILNIMGFTARFLYIVRANEKNLFMNKILILGAGLVVKPMVEYLLENNFTVKIATATKEKADRMINGHPNGSSMRWSANESGILEKLVSEHDLTVSFLPYKFHVQIAKTCIRCSKPLITTSYVQPEMMALDEEAKNAGIIILNEIGLDPGIDHMTAMKVIDKIHKEKGKVEEFYSLCGALPAPEAADNPMKYKFSWSPRGVIMAGMNSALYLKKGRQVKIDPENLFKDRFGYIYPNIGELEVYPNRDSISYIDIYKIKEVSTMYRGTIRYKGWCETLDAMKTLNMLSREQNDYSGMTYSGFLAERAGTEITDLAGKIAGLLGTRETSAAIKSFEWLGFLSDEKINAGITSPFDITSARMIRRMQLAENERDMVLMQHIFLASYPDGRSEVIKSSLLDFGTPATNTAVARTVALPASIALVLILNGTIDLTGVHRPVLPQIYNPVLRELKTLGIEMKEEYGLPESQMIK